MNLKRKAILSCIASAGLLALQPVLSDAAPRPPSGGSPGAGSPGVSGHGPSHSGGQRHYYSGGSRHHVQYGRPGAYHHYGYGYRYPYYGYSGNYGTPYWAWGLGLGVPLGLAWGSAYYPSYAYGPVYGSYGYGCGYDEDCVRERLSSAQPVEPTTQVPPPAPGEDGGPTQRPLHLNYCDSARAWFPHVRSCPGGWRLVLPEYNR